MRHVIHQMPIMVAVVVVRTQVVENQALVPKFVSSNPTMSKAPYAFQLTILQVPISDIQISSLGP